MDVDRAIKAVGIAVGAALLLAGGALLAAPDAATLPGGLVVAEVAAVVSLVLIGLIVRERIRNEHRSTQIPDVEYRLETPAPGEDIDEMLYRLTRLREGTIEYREQIEDAVGEIAIAVIQGREDCTREEAIERLRSGSWTDDEYAASFFAGGDGSRESALNRLRTRFGRTESEYERHLRAAVDALAERANELESADGTNENDRTPEDDGETRGGMAADHVVRGDFGTKITETASYRDVLSTNHWTGITAFAIAAVAIGTITAQPAILLSSVLGLAVAGYARIGSPPELADIEVTRSLSESAPEPGQEVEVTVEVENAGGSLFPDLRLVDRVPPGMEVIDGAARLGTSLRSGGTARFQYTIIAERGTHRWPVQVVGRDGSGAIEREALLETEAELRCSPRLRTTAETPVRPQTSLYSGEVDTRTGGDGLEFFSIREYRPEDPLRRINWKEYAKSGEFSTIDFRQERAAKVALMFDAREASYRSPAPGAKHAVDRSVEAAFDVFASLYDQGHLVGIAAFDSVPCWLAPSTGEEHLEATRRLFLEHPALASLPPDLKEVDPGRYVDPMTHIRRQLPPNTQVFLFSPLTTDYAFEVARRLDSAGHLITVISPDITTEKTIGQRLAKLERSVRVVQLREHGIRVVDWRADEPLGLELERARQRWSA